MNRPYGYATGSGRGRQRGIKYDPFRHHRRSIRLRGYDYSRCGIYFVTICTRDRRCLLGEVRPGAMRLNALGQVVKEVWECLPRWYPDVTLDAFHVMPNHVHGNLCIHGVGAIHESPSDRRTMLLPLVVGRFKAASAKRINAIRGTPGVPVWQRNYYERVLRNDDELDRSRRYIHDNPQRWDEDPERPR